MSVGSDGAVRANIKRTDRGSESKMDSSLVTADGAGDRGSDEFMQIVWVQRQEEMLSPIESELVLWICQSSCVDTRAKYWRSDPNLLWVTPRTAYTWLRQTYSERHGIMDARSGLIPCQ